MQDVHIAVSRRVLKNPEKKIIDRLRVIHRNFPSKNVAEHPPHPKTMSFICDTLACLSAPLIVAGKRANCSI